ncbi:hypothetical protein L9F63_011479, partial [Diploptera punctata]
SSPSLRGIDYIYLANTISRYLSHLIDLEHSGYQIMIEIEFHRERIWRTFQNILQSVVITYRMP